MQEFKDELIIKALRIYDDIYWEFSKRNPQRRRMGIRINPANNHITYDGINIDRDIFNYLVNFKKLLEPDPTKNYFYGGRYYVTYSLRKEIQKEASERSSTDAFEREIRHKRLMSSTRGQKIDEFINNRYKNAAE